jgi:tRNA (guanine37-N1)-methyltransferase
MILMPEPVFKAVEEVRPQRPLILLGPCGRKFDQEVADELATLEGFSLLCGRYEGVDERIKTDLCDDEISIGDFVLAGGELAALAIIETVARLEPGVLGNESSTKEESFSDGLLEYPQFTRPSNFRDLEVPEILLSGDHGKIERWRKASSLAKTLSLRPDLITIRGGLSEEEKKLLEEFGF